MFEKKKRGGCGHSKEKRDCWTRPPLSKKQIDIYKEILREEAILKSVKEDGSSLTVTNRLCQLCSHPLLLSKEWRGAVDRMEEKMVRDSEEVQRQSRRFLCSHSQSKS